MTPIDFEKLEAEMKDFGSLSMAPNGSMSSAVASNELPVMLNGSLPSAAMSNPGGFQMQGGSSLYEEEVGHEGDVETGGLPDVTMTKFGEPTYVPISSNSDT